ncbi:MAG: hypothetical protein AAGI01_01770 [Myxococcota bacterium]
MSFGELRSILQDTPDGDRWRHLCRVLDDLPADERRSVAIPYALAHLERWDDVLRTVPWRWVEGLFSGVSHEGLELVRTLDFRGRKLRADQLERILRAPFASGVRHIYLQDNAIGGAGVRELLRSGVLGHTEVLHLDRNGMGDRAITELMRGELPMLRDLSLDGNRIWDDGVAALADAYLPALEELDIGGNRYTASGVRRMVTASWAPGLRRFTMDWAPGVRRGLVHALSEARFEVLEEFSMAGHHQGPDLGVLLGEAPWIGGIRDLGLDWNKLGALGIQGLLKGSWGELRMLDLARNVIGDRGAQALSLYEAWGALRELDLQWNGITRVGREALERASWWGEVREVRLEFNPSTKA